MIYAVVILISVVMLCASLLICCKAGEKEGICKYGKLGEEDGEQ